MNNPFLNHDCATISNHIDSDDSNINKKTLKSTLLYLGYGVAEIDGERYFVVNISDNPLFVDTIKKLGEIFCQDSVSFLDKENESNIPLSIETFDKLQINSKRIVKELSKPIIDML